MRGEGGGRTAHPPARSLTSILSPLSRGEDEQLQRCVLAGTSRSRAKRGCAAILEMCPDQREIAAEPGNPNSIFLLAGSRQVVHAVPLSTSPVGAAASTFQPFVALSGISTPSIFTCA